MECFYCKGTMEKGQTTYTINRKGYHIVIDHVPAYICKQCGEPYFESNGIRLVQEIIHEVDNKTEQLQAVG